MLKTTLLILTGLLIALIVRWGWGQYFSFRAQSISHYADQTPAFDIRKTLAGPMVAEGVIFDFRGRVASRFTARMDGVWQGNAGTLSEAFVYSSGKTQSRHWTLEVSENGQITGLAPDIIGKATGWQRGAAVVLNYRLRLPAQSGGHVIDVVDWMYLTDSGTILNRSEFRKFGFKVGEMVATFRKTD